MDRVAVCPERMLDDALTIVASYSLGGLHLKTHYLLCPFAHVHADLSSVNGEDESFCCVHRHGGARYLQCPVLFYVYRPENETFDVLRKKFTFKEPLSRVAKEFRGHSLCHLYPETFYRRSPLFNA